MPYKEIPEFRSLVDGDGYQKFDTPENDAAKIGPMQQKITDVPGGEGNQIRTNQPSDYQSVSLATQYADAPNTAELWAAGTRPGINPWTNNEAFQPGRPEGNEGTDLGEKKNVGS